MVRGFCQRAVDRFQPIFNPLYAIGLGGNQKPCCNKPDGPKAQDKAFFYTCGKKHDKQQNPRQALIIIKGLLFTLKLFFLSILGKKIIRHIKFRKKIMAEGDTSVASFAISAIVE